MRRGLKELGPTFDDMSNNLGTEAVQNQLGYRGKRTAVLAKKGKNVLVSPAESTRILRSRSQEKSKAPEPLISNLVEDGGSKNRKKKERVKNVSVDEFLRIRRNLSYLVNRIKYEQTLIDAYSGEGWKGQSIEKIKPEKELQRAKSEILRRKLKIRDLFQRLHMLCTAGRRNPELLSDSAGEIDSEDLYCAKCGSKEFPANKDIIICDGICERGFHLFCLEPPILKQDLHLYEDNWLCPACDCKFDCIDLVNDLHGTDLCMTDSWEKVFPEAAAGKKLDEDSGLPSDDSDDYDFDPDGPVLNEKVEESDDSDSSSSSEDSSKALPNEEQYLGLPSDDSEDDDFNPGIEEVDEEVKKESSDSDFTSDSEDFSVVFDDKEKSLNEPKPEYVKCNGEDDSAVISDKRHVERLDYKKLHDEEYGSGSSDSSDEDYTDISAAKKKKNKRGEVGSVSPDREALSINPIDSKRTPKRRTNKKVEVEGTSSSPVRARSCSKSSSKSTNKRLGEAVTQRLYEYFKENQYPDLAMKESLAKELGITANQVNKWFTNTRWSYRHPSAKKLKMENNTSNNGT